MIRLYRNKLNASLIISFPFKPTGSRSSENEKNSEEENDEYQSIPSFQSSFTNALLLGELNIMSDEESSTPGKHKDKVLQGNYH